MQEGVKGWTNRDYKIRNVYKSWITSSFMKTEFRYKAASTVSVAPNQKSVLYVVAPLRDDPLKLKVNWHCNMAQVAAKESWSCLRVSGPKQLGGGLEFNYGSYSDGVQTWYKEIQEGQEYSWT